MNVFYWVKLGIIVKFNFVNFDGRPNFFGLSKRPNHPGGIDLDIVLVRDNGNAVLKKIKKGRLKHVVKETPQGLYSEILDVSQKKAVYFFEKELSLDFILNRAINQSFLYFQERLGMVFLHAASIVIDGKVNLFAAPSGGGKTTLARLASEKALTVMNDEFCIVKKRGSKYFAGLLPGFVFSGENIPDYEVGNVFLLNKAPVSRTKPIAPQEAIRRLLPETMDFPDAYLHGAERKKCRRHVFEFLDTMSREVEFKQLDFKIHPDVFTCLK